MSVERAARILVPCLLLTAFGACGDDDGGETPTETVEQPVLGSCEYVSPFTMSAECREYVGEGWTDSSLESACADVSGTFSAEARCATEQLLGRCEIDLDTDNGYVVFSYGTDGCASQKSGCEIFGGGTWRPEPICDDGSGGSGPGGSVFIQPTLECVDPVAGEPAGQGPNGQVCTWQAISGSTEEGRAFADYASCDVVRTQRPFYQAPPSDRPTEGDPRMDDPDYVAELAWVRSQIEASACVCCHSEDAPGGPSNWTIDAPGNWINTFEDSGLALGANYVESIAFGAFPPEENNNFDRINSGFPSTDPQRMVAFFVAELDHRGRAEADFANTPPFGGPLHDQIFYQPEACADGVGVAADGTINWEGGDARYVYVLNADVDRSPTVPPNLDLPDGTLWRIDVPSDGTPVASGSVTYGTAPDGTAQRFPEDGTAATLVAGTTYYLYATQDVGIPITRCLFTY